MSQIVQLAHTCGWACYHTYDSRRSVQGFPDLIMVRRGQLIAAELKVGKRKPTPQQLAWLEVLGQVPGVIAKLWTPECWNEIEALLTAHDPHPAKKELTNACHYCGGVQHSGRTLHMLGCPEAKR